MALIINDLNEYQIVSYYPHNNSLSFGNYLRNNNATRMTNYDVFIKNVDVWRMCFPKATEVTLDMVQCLNLVEPKIPVTAYWAGKTSTFVGPKDVSNEIMLWKDEETRVIFSSKF